LLVHATSARAQRNGTRQAAAWGVDPNFPAL